MTVTGEMGGSRRDRGLRGAPGQRLGCRCRTF